MKEPDFTQQAEDLSGYITSYWRYEGNTYQEDVQDNRNAIEKALRAAYIQGKIDQAALSGRED